MVNRIFLIGRLGKDPLNKITTNNKSHTWFSLAVNEHLGKKEVTTWFSVSTWGATANNCFKYLKRGALVAVEGRMYSYDYNDPTTNSTYVRWGVDAQNVSFLEARGNNGASGNQQNDSNTSYGYYDENDVSYTETRGNNGASGNQQNVDDIPF